MWDGIRVLAASDAKLRHYPPEDIRMGWFHAPHPFSSANAMLPFKQDQWWQMPYPAVFVKSPDGELWVVRCVAILLNEGRTWYTHWSRITLITTEDNVIPPPFRPAHVAEQPVASSAATSTASGTSPTPSLSGGTSSSDDETAYMIIPDVDLEALD